MNQKLTFRKKSDDLRQNCIEREFGIRSAERQTLVYGLQRWPTLGSTRLWRNLRWRQTWKTVRSVSRCRCVRTASGDCSHCERCSANTPSTRVTNHIVIYRAHTPPMEFAVRLQRSALCLRCRLRNLSQDFLAILLKREFGGQLVSFDSVAHIF